MRRIVAPILAGVELAGTAFIATLLIAAPARAQEPAPYDPPPMLTIEARPFGADSHIPSQFEPRHIQRNAPAVAKAAKDSGVARRPVEDLKAYT